LTGLDEGLKDRVLSYLDRAMAEWRIPTVFVSHDQADVRRLAESVVVIESGKVIDAGSTSTTLDRAVLTRLKQRPGLVNLLRVSEIHQAGGHWAGRVGSQILHLPPGLPPGSAGSVYVQFLAHDVVLSAAAVEGTSARNHLQGKVREVVTLPDQT